MPVLVEINSGREANKTGILPEDMDNFIQHLVEFQHIQVQGLMTMGPRFGDPENAILREKQIKAGSRQKKIDLINSINADWDDLYARL